MAQFKVINLVLIETISELVHNGLRESESLRVLKMDQIAKEVLAFPTLRENGKG